MRIPGTTRIDRSDRHRAFRGGALLLGALLALPTLGGCRTRLLVQRDDDPPVDAGPDLPPTPDLTPLPDLTIPRDNCGAYTIQTTRVIRPDLLIVQDKSRSMGWGVDGNKSPPAGQSKWELTRAAIEQVVATTTFVDWGLMLFGTAEQCGALTNPNVSCGPDTAATIRAVLENTTLDAGTPTTLALKNALAWFKKVNDNRPHYMLLSTDGLPACANGPGGNPNAADGPGAIAAVAAAAAAGVKTFVAGIGTGSAEQSTLSAMAMAGGVPNTTPGQPAYFPIGNSQDLVQVLQDAAIRITPCSYPLEHEPPVRDRVTIQDVFGVIPRDPLHVNGWDYGDDGVSIAFYGSACDELKKGTVTSVDAIYACPGDLSM